jgi:uncharacterized phiE125 gp8 family phage protein
MNSITVTIPPHAEPLGIQEIYNHLRITSTDEEAYILNLGTAAREMVESDTGRALVAQTFQLKLDEFPDEIILPRSPVISVSSITYKDTAGATQTLATTEYILHTADDPPKITLAYSKSWPSVYDEPRCITVTFIAGYAAKFTAATNGTCTIYGRTLTNGDVVRVSNSGGALPTGLSANTDYYVVNVSGSTFNLSATLGGSAIDITGTGSGNNFIGVIPQAAKHAMLMLISDLYEHRESQLDRLQLAENLAYQRLVNKVKLHWYQ